MNKAKQQLYRMLLEEFDKKPGFTLARTLFLFCADNEDFELPEKVKISFIEGIRDQEIRAFGLTYTKPGAADEPSEMKKEIVRKIAKRPPKRNNKDDYQELVIKLAAGTGKIYTPQMVKKMDRRFKGALSYNDILEVFILAGHPGGKE